MIALASHSPELSPVSYEQADRRTAGIFQSHSGAGTGTLLLTVSGLPDMGQSIRHALRIDPAVSCVVVAQSGVRAIYQKAAGFWRTWVI
ncbi:hypothetical protein LP421_10565 [Rhizobium sp. RCAM05350]|nr:hypothetical protein LP421_10565 [Rhizobium sp. RCAM05350]